VYRGIFSAMFDDPDYQRLSPPARLTLLTMRLCSQVGIAGIFRVYVPVLAEQTGFSADQVEAALEELATSPSRVKPWIYREHGVVWIRTALRHDPTVRIADWKHLASVRRALEALPRVSIVARFRKFYGIARASQGSAPSPGRGGGDLLSPSPESRDLIPEESRDLRPEDRGPTVSPNGHRTHGQVREMTW
jgi:hypothetical protein